MPEKVWENRVPRGRLKSGTTVVIICSILIGEQIMDAVQMRVV
jgi:hypothetical protein